MGYRRITNEHVQNILTLLDKGLSNTETASILGVSVKTVDRAKKGKLPIQQRARQNTSAISNQSQQLPEIPLRTQDFQEKSDVIIYLLEKLCCNTQKLLEVWQGK